MRVFEFSRNFPGSAWEDSSEDLSYKLWVVLLFSLSFKFYELKILLRLVKGLLYGGVDLPYFHVFFFWLLSFKLVRMMMIMIIVITIEKILQLLNFELCQTKVLQIKKKKKKYCRFTDLGFEAKVDVIFTCLLFFFVGYNLWFVYWFVIVNLIK